MGFKTLTYYFLRNKFKGKGRQPLTLNTNSLAPGDKFNIFLFDANSLYYLVSLFIEKFEMTEEETLEHLSFLTAAVILNIYNIIGKTSNINSNIIGLFYDGPPPISKLITQISRRSQDAEIERLENKDINTLKLNTKTHASFEHMQMYIKKTVHILTCVMKTLEYHNHKIQFFINTNKVPGEGEHKIYDFYSNFKFNKGDKVIIVSDDSDIPLIGMLRFPNNNITFLRKNIDDLANSIDYNISTNDIRKFTIFYLFNNILKLNQNTLIAIKIGTFMKFFYEIEGFPIFKEKLNKLYNVNPSNININLDYSKHNTDIKKLKLSFNLIFHFANISNIKEMLYKPNDKINYKLTIYKISLFIILYSYIGSDFSPERVDIKKKVMATTIGNIVTSINNIKDFNKFLKISIIIRDKKYYLFHKINHKNIFNLLYNNLVLKEDIIDKKYSKFFIYRTSLREERINTDDYMTTKLGLTNKEIVTEYFKGINYTLEYFALGIKGGSKKYYNRIPIAPSMKMINKVLTEGDINIDDSFSILNDDYIEHDYLDDKFMRMAFKTTPSFVYSRNMENQVISIPILVNLFNLFDNKLRKYKIKRKRTEISPVSNSEIYLLDSKYIAMRVSVKVKNCIELEYENSDIITNINLENRYKSGISISELVSMYQIETSLDRNQVISHNSLSISGIDPEDPSFVKVCYV